MKNALITAGNVVAHVEGVDDETKGLLLSAMSYVVEGHEHMNCGGWDGRTTLFDWDTSKFPAGFVPTALHILKQAGYEPSLRRKPLPEPLGPKPTPDCPLVDNFPRDDRYDYQFKAVDVLEKHGAYICRAATGAGKSRLARLCIMRIGRKTLFLTTRQVLLYQMGDALDEMQREILAKLSDNALLAVYGADIAARLRGVKCSYVGDGVWDTSGDVVLGMVQTLNDRLNMPTLDTFKNTQEQVEAKMSAWQLKNEQAKELLGQIEFVIGEEAHEAGGNAYYTVLKHCRNAAYRLALTGTPLMRDGESNMRLIASFGPIRLQISEETLINRGILARPVFKFVDLETPPTLRRTTNWQKAEDLGIVNNVMRNRHIVAEAKRATAWGLPTLVLVKRQKHGKLLAEMMKKNGVRVEFIFGESGHDKRKAALAKLTKGDLDAVIGSTILDVGVDVPAVNLLILAGGGKAEVATRQRIGRVLRAKKAGTPNVSYVVDFTDRGNKHLVSHYKTRQEIVKQTPGFVEGILPSKKDFSFAADGFQRMKAAA